MLSLAVHELRRIIAPAGKGKAAEEPQRSGFWSGTGGGGGVDLQRGNRGRRRKLVFRARTMPGCAALLLFLVVLPMGSDARRIRKRGLNHKVRLHTLRTEIISNLSTSWFQGKVLESI